MPMYKPMVLLPEQKAKFLPKYKIVQVIRLWSW